MTRLTKCFYEGYDRGALFSSNIPHYLEVDFAKPTILMMYPKNFTPICTTELLEARERYSEIQAAGVQFYAGSTDSPESHQRFYGEIGDMPFPVLHLRRSTLLGRFINENGYSGRTTLFIKEWSVAGIYPSSIDKKRSLDKTLAMSDLLITRIRV